MALVVFNFDISAFENLRQEVCALFNYYKGKLVQNERDPGFNYIRNTTHSHMVQVLTHTQ